MPKALLIAEKPSLMRTIQAVYDKNKAAIPYEITFVSQRGHLVTLKLPSEIDEEQKHWKWENLPFHPEQHGGWQYKVIQEKKEGKNLTAAERLDQIKKELKSGAYDFVINAGDPDQEGELLVRLVLEYIKNTLPVKRFWSNDLTETHVLKALQNLKEDDTDPMCVNLYAAAKGRQHSDYRFGMNLSEAASLKMHTRVACGRVKTPILAIVCRREEEIRNFKPKTVYGVKSVYAEGFDGLLFDAASTEAEEEEDEKTDEAKKGLIWFDTKKEAEDLIARLPATAEVLSFEKKRVETYAPKLYKLETLQVDAGKRGYNDARTLQIIQSLYEKELLSYPRTDCEYLSSDENFEGILRAVLQVPELNPFIRTISKGAMEKVRKSKKWINDKALEDAGHSAIRPTTKPADMATLTAEEQEIYTMVCRRFVAIFLPPVVQDKTCLIAKAGTETFKSTGKTLVDAGYSKVFGTKFSDMVIPEKKAGDILPGTTYELTEKTSICPKRYTSPGLVEVCENPAKFLDDPTLKALGKRLKIGTSATRSAIIRTLIVTDKYMAEKKEGKTTYVMPTPVGEAIIKNLGPCDICKVDLTGIWEEKLEMVRQGATTLAELEDGMKVHVENLIRDIREREMSSMSTEKKYEVIGTCPKCGKELCEGAKGFFCMGFKSKPPCGLGTYKEVSGAMLTAEEFKSMLAGETIEKECKKDGKSWKQKLKYNLDTCKIEFVSGDMKVFGTCPKCGGQLTTDGRVFRCSGGDVEGYHSLLGATMTNEEVIRMLSGETVVKTLKKDKKSWEQPLTYSFEEKRFTFVKAQEKESERTCPCCGKRMKETARQISCDCGFALWKTGFFGHDFSAEELDGLFADGTTPKIDGLKGKSGKLFSGYAVVDVEEKKVKLAFD